MKAQELIADLPLGPGDRRQGMLQARLLLAYLADNVGHAELESGMGLRDLTDVKAWLRELVAASTGVPRHREIGARPRVTNLDFCPDCGHIHIDDSECSFPIGGGRTCRCERVLA